MADHMVSVSSYHTAKERQFAAVPELQNRQPYQQYLSKIMLKDSSHKQKRSLQKSKQVSEPEGSQDPLREIPAASAESLPCLLRFQEGL